MPRGLGVGSWRSLIVALCALALLASPVLVQASAARSGRASATVAAKKKKKKHKAHCTVPRLKGDSLHKAKVALKRAHCGVGKIKHEGSSKVRKGRVISSKPRAGTKHKAGKKVALTVSSGSKGPPPPKGGCQVPLLTGKTLAAAVAALKKAHCGVGKVKKKKSATVPSGEVISSSPAAGKKLKAGKKVNLVVSSGSKPGPPPPACVVPNVVGQTQAAAEAALTAAGCAIGTVTQKNSAKVPKGDVIRTNPKAGKKLKAGKKVSLVVSSGPKGYPIPNPK